MARALLTLALVTAVLAVAWLRLETTSARLGEVLVILGLAVAPALAILLMPRRRLRWIVATALAAVATLVAAGVAFDVPVTDARPRSEVDFFGPVFDRIHDGFLDYYDTTLPFDRLEFALMHGLLLMAMFGFVLAASLLVAARRPVGAGLVLLVGAGWPTTLYPGGRPLLAGAVALAAILGILFLLRSGARGARGLGPAVAVGIVLVTLAVGVSSQNAVAKSAIVAWQGWDLYDAPEDPVGVRYVWNSHYQGIRFPEKPTVVLRVKVTGAEDRKLYWRATTLDDYTGIGWREALDLAPAERTSEIDETALDPLLPDAAANEDAWIKQEVEVAGLSDDHLIASAQPVRWRPGTGAPVQTAAGGVVVLPQELRPGQRYTAWSYVPEVKPAELVQGKGVYAPELQRFLELIPGIFLPAWGAQARDARVERLFDRQRQNFLLISYEPVYALARRVVGGAKSPYAAALALESWFREQGGFTYDEQPKAAGGAEPPLVTFVLRSRVGYCQHYAGAMAVMLRLLGVPARVAAGFTTGKLDKGSGTWVVTDHNAHTWVEVYFPGYGWLPFDPTPGRGELTAEYSAVSAAFAAPDLARAQQALGRGGVLDAITAQALRGQSRPGLEGVRGFGSGLGEAGAQADSALGGRTGIVLVALLVVAGALGLLVLAKELRRRLRFAARDPRALATACRRDLVGFLADQRIAAPGTATLQELGELVEREFVVDAGPFVRSVSRARYGPPAGSERAVRAGRRELKALRVQMGRQLGVSQRLRGLFRLRSLAI